MAADFSRCSSTLGPINFRQRTLRAAHARLEAGGVEALNLRDIAADLQTGVGSLYYHFRNKDALLAELAVDGFAQLKQVIRAALDDPRHRTPFHAAADAYVHFARRRPALYALMHDVQLLAANESVRLAERDALAAFAMAFDGFEGAPETINNLALALWALGRGIGAMTLSLGDGDPAQKKVLTRRIVDGLNALAGEPVKLKTSIASRAA